MDTKLIVVVGGAGKLGRLIVNSLLAHPDTRVRALVRNPGKPEVAALAQDRVELAAFDAVSADDEARADAVRGAFTVVSALQGFGPDIIIDAQLSLIRAAKAAGARRFIPSAFAYDFFTLPAGINVHSDWRRTLGESARSEVSDSFEVVHVLQGMFADRNVLGFLGLFDGEKGIVRYWGDGTTPIDWTTWEDTARFTAAAALDERKVPERLFVSGDRMDILTFAKTWESIRGRKLSRERLGSLEELERETKRRIAQEPRNVPAWLPLMYARGVFGGQALLGPSHNSRYPEIHAENLAAAIARGAL
ncbi:NmrA family NAD(P)-binding protein [Vitiosangium sp. GDMCC 1.1324]|uniref:NmrA family NAD(P)-binding protein n=1 Tax=Vitiosangium sp. (strain GDMCC 1.1324) TaxID=2138576 RepID=UPI000D3B556E|nr:NmrA family NAD(P)-binding protein [Vitiosangium sp. GDMCC 1.1324]PTL79239.1 NmrA family protein [Vitiosangium sp. GDMCC 1.1324]